MGVVRKTKSVKEVLSKFEDSAGAISVVELIELLGKSMNKTTVYRILERLEDDGMLHSFSGESGLRWYARCKGCSASSHYDAHPHLQCRACGKTECVPSDIPIPSMPNWKIDSASILLIGECENCRI